MNSSAIMFKNAIQEMHSFRRRAFFQGVGDISYTDIIRFAKVSKVQTQRHELQRVRKAVIRDILIYKKYCEPRCPATRLFNRKASDHE